MMRALVCTIAGHRFTPISRLPLAGKIRARCDRCGDVRFVRLVP